MKASCLLWLTLAIVCTATVSACSGREKTKAPAGTAASTPDAHHTQPVGIDACVQEKYPGCHILDHDTDNGLTEVKISHEGREKILIFDEPCTGLDPEGMYHVRKTMGTLAAEGRSVVLVTHYPEDIIPEIGRVLLIKDAEVFADGAKAELLTSEVMSDLFDVPLVVGEACGWYSLRGAYA